MNSSHGIVWEEAEVLASNQRSHRCYAIEAWHIHSQPLPINRGAGLLPTESHSFGITLMHFEMKFHTSKAADLNPSTTNDDYSHHQNSAACYQLAQSILKIGAALAERVGRGEGGG